MRMILCRLYSSRIFCKDTHHAYKNPPNGGLDESGLVEILVTTDPPEIKFRHTGRDEDSSEHTDLMRGLFGQTHDPVIQTS